MASCYDETIDFDDYESLQYFQRVLIHSGVIDALRNAGIVEGDTVSLYDLEFDFLNSWRNMERLFNEDCDPKQLSPLTLAFVGDADLNYLSESVWCLANCPVKVASKCSCASALSSARLMELLMPILTEEIAVLKGRNAHPPFPKMRNRLITMQPQVLKQCLAIYI